MNSHIEDFKRWSAGRRLSNSRHELTRREKKSRYIRAKNLMREYPDCNYGEFYCDHVYDPQYPWVWVDFRFFHSTKKRYYAVAMTTLEYKAYTMVEDAVLSELSIDEIDPPRVHDSVDARLTTISLKPSIELKNYGPVAVGMYATVNTPHIDEHIIRNFITFFRSLGEPVSAGWEWHGEEIQVDPRRLQTARQG